MNAPKMTFTRWKRLGATAEVDENGIIHASYHFMEVDSGEDFTVTISGRAKANAGLLIGALEAAAATLREAAGVPQPDSTTAVPPPKQH